MFNKNRVYILLAFLLLLTGKVSGQTRTIFGRVIDEDLIALPGIQIRLNDRALIGTTRADGRFDINITQNTNTLIFDFVGFEPTPIKINNSCDTIEVILLSSASYDFMSSKKIDRLRLKQFNTAPKLHLEAFNKGIFTTKFVCYSTEFHPQKPSIDSIQKEMAKIAKLNKLNFEKIKIGDTVEVPFGGRNNFDRAGKINLIVYSGFSTNNNKAVFDFVTECEVVSKKSKDLNLVLKVIHYDFNGYKALWRDKEIKTGELFDYNMGAFKILLKQSNKTPLINR